MKATQHPAWIEQKEKYRIRRENFIAGLNETEKVKIITDWVAEQTSLYEPTFPRSDAERKLSDCMHNSDVGWEMINRILSLTENKKCLARLGAWHLEEWLAIHRGKAIVLVEAAAGKDILFSRVLSCVYQNSLSSEEYARIREVALYDGYFDGV